MLRLGTGLRGLGEAAVGTVGSRVADRAGRMDSTESHLVATRPSGPPSEPRKSPWSGLFPTEHGAYGVLLFPIASALALPSVTGASWALATAFVLGFLAHRALLLVMGYRPGPPAARPRCLALLLGFGAASASAAGLGAALAPPAARGAIAVPLLAVLALLATFAARRERTLAGEILACLALTTCSIPVALAGGQGAPARALTIALVWSLGLTTATVAVRSVIERRRGKGRFLGGAVVLIGAMAIGTLALLSREGLAPTHAALALGPLVALGLGLTVRPPHPRRLRAIGWSLVMASTLTLGIIVALLG